MLIKNPGDDLNHLDECALYFSDDGDEYELIGNFRHHVTSLLHAYGKKYENLQLLRNAWDDLKHFSKRCVSTPIWVYMKDQIFESVKIEIGNA